MMCGYAVALDMSRRDMQTATKVTGRPWEAAKAFERSAPIAPLVPAVAVAEPSRGAITLLVGGVLRPSGDLAQMAWSTPEIIAALTRLVTLATGDFTLTGAPAGVGPVGTGDVMHAAIAGVFALRVTVI